MTTKFTQRIEELRTELEQIANNKQMDYATKIRLHNNCATELKALQEGYDLAKAEDTSYHLDLNKEIFSDKCYVGYISKKEIEDVLDKFGKDTMNLLFSCSSCECTKWTDKYRNIFELQFNELKQSLKLGENNVNNK